MDHVGSAPIRIVAPFRVTVGADAVQLTASANVHGVIIKAICPAQKIYLGASSAVTTATGYPLQDGESVMFLSKNADQFWAIASAAAQEISVVPFYRA